MYVCVVPKVYEREKLRLPPLKFVYINLDYKFKMKLVTIIIIKIKIRNIEYYMNRYNVHSRYPR